MDENNSLKITTIKINILVIFNMEQMKLISIWIDNDIEINNITNVMLTDIYGQIHKGEIMENYDNKDYIINFSYRYSGQLLELKNYTSYLDEIKINNTIQSIIIDMKYCYIDDTCLHNILNMWLDENIRPIFKKVTKIILSHNKITHIGLHELFNFLKDYCPNIEILNININNILHSQIIDHLIPENIKESFKYNSY